MAAARGDNTTNTKVQISLLNTQNIENSRDDMVLGAHYPNTERHRSNEELQTAS